MPLRPLAVGDILDFAFQIYRRDVRLYLSIALVGLGPASILMAAFPPPATGESELLPEGIGIYLLLLLVYGICLATVSAALCVAMDTRVNGGGISMGGSFGRAFGRSPVFLTSWFLALLLMMAFGVVATLVGAVSVAPFVGSGGLWLAFIVVFVLFLLANVWWVGGVFAIPPAVMLEKLGPGTAISRSFALSRGGRWRIFAVLLVTWIITTMPSWALYAVTGTLDAIFSGDPAGTMGGDRYWLIETFASLLAIAVKPLMSAVVILLYYDRRVRTEAYDLQAAAEAMAD